MADSTEKLIMAKLVEILEELTWVKTVEGEVVRNLFTDFNESELPAIQVFDRAPAVVQHAKARIDVQWPIAVELVLKSSKAGLISQGDLFDRKQEMEDKISAHLSLDGAVPGFIHMRYDGFETDLHTTPGYFAVSLSLTAVYSKAFPGCG